MTVHRATPTCILLLRKEANGPAGARTEMLSVLRVQTPFTLDVSLRTEAAKRGRIVRDWRLGQLDSEMQRWPNHPSPLHNP